ncbi:hypothetical protein [Neisseria dumasiana]|uniref:Uncharacterized protein n=1 Tax=Neisseria dumasiana TaxID=1931275 RepID=A0A1X3D3C7_9NEIS|nr:hypothetical protein [Neisseria dumasiana]OSI14211.1 hypothetical protein BV912_12660 [Neisseria dumasiana]
MSGGEQRARVKREETEKAAKRSSIPQQKETRVIYIPGQPVNNISTNNDYQVILATVREVVFNFSINGSRKISVEVEKVSSSVNVRDYGVFDLKTKKLISGKFFLTSGEPYRVHISRYFKGTFVVKAGGKIIGRYTPRLMDTNRYGSNPFTWIEPLYIGFNETNAQKDIFPLLQKHNNISQGWLRGLPQFSNSMQVKPPYKPEKVEMAFKSACETPASQHGVLLVYKLQEHHKYSVSNALRNGQEMKVSELKDKLNQQDFEELVRVVGAYAWENKDLILSTTEFTKDNIHWAKALNKKVQVKWVRGYLAIVFKGYKPPFGFTYASLKHDKVKGLTGGVSVRKGKRIWLSLKNAKVVSGAFNGATKGVAGFGLMLDVIGDYDTVMVDENGSRSVMEFVGRVGVSLVAAGVGAALATTALTAITYGMGALVTAGAVASIPVALVVGIGALVVIGVGVLVSSGADGLKKSIWG